jgi:hypothetical protein
MIYFDLVNVGKYFEPMCPKFLKEPKCGSQSEIMGKKRSQCMFFRLQHFKGRKACWNSGLRLKQTHKQKFKMTSTYTTKKKRRLVQVECKWCDEFSKENFKHKLYTTHNLWEEAPLCSL